MEWSEVSTGALNALIDQMNHLLDGELPEQAKEGVNFVRRAAMEQLMERRDGHHVLAHELSCLKMRVEALERGEEPEGEEDEERPFEAEVAWRELSEQFSDRIEALEDDEIKPHSAELGQHEARIKKLEEALEFATSFPSPIDTGFHRNYQDTVTRLQKLEDRLKGINFHPREKAPCDEHGKAISGLSTNFMELERTLKNRVFGVETEMKRVKQKLHEKFDLYLG